MSCALWYVFAFVEMKKKKNVQTINLKCGWISSRQAIEIFQLNEVY